VDETTLDTHYVLVRAVFLWRFETASTQSIDVKVDSTFIVYTNHGAPERAGCGNGPGGS
jgi:hypothetical protein